MNIVDILGRFCIIEYIYFSICSGLRSTCVSALRDRRCFLCPLKYVFLRLHSNLSKDGSFARRFCEKVQLSTRQAKRGIKYLRTQSRGSSLLIQREVRLFIYEAIRYSLTLLRFVGMEIPSRSEIRQTLLKAIEEEKALRVLLKTEGPFTSILLFGRKAGDIRRSGRGRRASLHTVGEIMRSANPEESI